MRALGNAMLIFSIIFAEFERTVNIAFPSALIWGGSEAGSTKFHPFIRLIFATEVNMNIHLSNISIDFQYKINRKNRILNRLFSAISA